MADPCLNARQLQQRTHLIDLKDPAVKSLNWVEVLMGKASMVRKSSNGNIHFAHASWVNVRLSSSSHLIIEVLQKLLPVSWTLSTCNATVVEPKDKCMNSEQRKIVHVSSLERFKFQQMLALMWCCVPSPQSTRIMPPGSVTDWSALTHCELVCSGHVNRLCPALRQDSTSLFKSSACRSTMEPNSSKPQSCQAKAFQKGKAWSWGQLAAWQIWGRHMFRWPGSGKTFAGLSRIIKLKGIGGSRLNRLTKAFRNSRYSTF